MNTSVACVLVTYNRLDFLKKSLDCLFKQSHKIDNIVIVNNNSTDGTIEYLKRFNNNDQISVINLKENVGGAGGFNVGLKKAHEFGPFDYYWIMDDDTLPTNNALRNLLKSLSDLDENRVGLLASNVRWGEKEEPAIMNIPAPSGMWNKYANKGLIKIGSSSFVSMLVSNKALEECGLPIKEFFIWGDDVDFSQRVTDKYDGYFVSDSIVNHATKYNTAVDLVDEENPNRIGRYFYAIRNKFYMDKQNGVKSIVKNEASYIYLVLILIFGHHNYKMKKIGALAKGHFFGWFFNPQVEYVNGKD